MSKSYVKPVDKCLHRSYADHWRASWNVQYLHDHLNNTFGKNMKTWKTLYRLLIYHLLLLIDTILFQTLMNFRKGQIKCKESTFKFLSVKESCRIIVWSLKTVNSPPFLAPAWIQSRFSPARTRVMPGHVSDCAAWHVSPGLATSEAQHLTNFETGGGKLLPSAENNSVKF